MQRALTPAYIQSYVLGDRFEWDEAKSQRNLQLRGFDFLFATLVFQGPTLVTEDLRRDYGERRFIATGIADELCLSVVYTDRLTSTNNSVRRIVSARWSKRKERRLYEEAARKT